MADIYCWPSTSLGKRLQLLDESLLCPICCDYFDNPHLLSCGHSFCSLCVRKHFDRKLNAVTFGQCPSCREKADSSQLRPNRVLSTIISLFGNVKGEIVKAVSLNQLTSSNDKSLPSPATTSTSKRNPNVVTRLVQKEFHKFSRERIRKELEMLCKPSSVPVLLDGSSEDLERRYREIVHLNNAQINSDNPMSLSECVKEINLRESQRLVEANKTSRISRKVEQLRNGEITASHRKGFNNLIQEIRERKRRVNNASASPPSQSDGASSQSCETENNKIGLNAPNGSVIETLEPTEELSMAQPCTWRCIFSEKLQRPFYYNPATRIGQFAVPHELLNCDAVNVAGGSCTSNNGIANSESSANPLSPQPTASQPNSQRSHRSLSSGEVNDTVGSLLNSQQSSESKRRKNNSRSYNSSQRDNDKGNSHVRDEPSSNQAFGSLSSDDEVIQAVAEADSDEEFEENRSVRQLESRLSEPPSTQIQTRRQSKLEAATSEVVDLSECQSVSTATASSSSSAEWSCGICTYLNQSRVTCCEMCSNPRERAKSSLPGLLQTFSKSKIRDSLGASFKSLNSAIKRPSGLSQYSSAKRNRR